MSVVVFGWDEPVVGVRAPGPWAELVGGLLPDYVLDAREAPVTLELLPSEGGGVLRTDTGDEGASSEQDLLALLEFELVRVLLRETDCVHLHASGAAASGRGLLALGPAGAGKSSVCLAWHRLGLPILGDDNVFIDASGSARAFRRLMKLEAERAREAGVDPASTLAWDPGNPEIWYSPGPEGWAPGAVPVAVVARVQYQAGSALEMRVLSPSETLNLLVHSLLESGRSGADALSPLALVAEGALGLDVCFGDSMAAAEALAAEARAAEGKGP